MPDHMFGDVVDPSIKVGGRRGYPVPFSIVVHTLAVVALVVFPLVIANGDRWPTPPALLAPSLPPAPPVTTQVPVRVVGSIRPPAKTRDVSPAYPSIARSARVQGMVIIEAVISPAGKVMNARILRSIPLLDAAALAAVRQWEYTPTPLNGIPVPVVMTVTVNFQLQ